MKRLLDLALGLAVIYPPARWAAAKIRGAAMGAEEASPPTYWGSDGCSAADLPLYSNEEVDRMLERLA